jgi:hypothetical protein
MNQVTQLFDFDEIWYLNQYPDVARAVENGIMGSGFDHYIAHGRVEGRSPNGNKPEPTEVFDAAWYGKTYLLVPQEVDATDAAALEQHYKDIGRHRGYLPNQQAPRPKNAAGFMSPFGGLWIDLANAQDIIDGKQEIGMITEEEAAQLRSFISDGYVVLKAAVAPDILDRAEAEVEAAYAGKYRELLFECPAVARDPEPWREGLKAHPAKAIDLHIFSQEIRDLIFNAPLLRFLHLLFERPPLATQSLSFYLGSGQPLHQDSIYVAYTLPLQFAASWIALEDVKPGGGELEYFVGSHRALPEFVYAGETKSVTEAQRVSQDRQRVVQDHERHLRLIEQEGIYRNLTRSRFEAKRGDMPIWHSELAHGGAKVSPDLTRKSVVTHYCPKEISPLFRLSSIFKHDTAAYYTTGAYLDK